MKNFKKLFFLSLILVFSSSLFAQVLEKPPLDDIAEPSLITPARTVKAWTPLRWTDIMWKERIWRIVDFREKINEPLYYPTEPANGRKSFMYVLIDAMKEQAITAYEAGGQTDEFLIPLSYEQWKKNMERKETIQKPDPLDPTIMKDTEIVVLFNPSNVKQIRLKEDWFFDKQRSVMDVRILGICPIVEMYEADGVTKKGDLPLFWIYFPAARKVFVNAETFNRFNDSQRLTYEDVFMKRFFGSYIYKQSNVFDRKIQEYMKGMDALLEAEKIKNDIFNIEHDLWEY